MTHLRLNHQRCCFFTRTASNLFADEFPGSNARFVHSPHASKCAYFFNTACRSLAYSKKAIAAKFSYHVYKGDVIAIHNTLQACA